MREKPVDHKLVWRHIWSLLLTISISECVTWSLLRRRWCYPRRRSSSWCARFFLHDTSLTNELLDLDKCVDRLILFRLFLFRRWFRWRWFASLDELLCPVGVLHSCGTRLQKRQNFVEERDLTNSLFSAHTLTLFIVTGFSYFCCWGSLKRNKEKKVTRWVLRNKFSFCLFVCLSFEEEDDW